MNHKNAFLFVLCVSIVFLNCVDAMTTIYGLGSGVARELNPIVCISQNTIILKLCLGLLFSVLLLVSGARALREQSKTAFNIVFFASLAITVYLFLVVTNNLIIIWRP